MSIALIVTRGYGNGTLVGTIKDIVLRGYDISTVIPPTVPIATGLVGIQSTGNGITSNQSTGNGIIGKQSAGNGVIGSGSL
jgi:hypothetical protein